MHEPAGQTITAVPPLRQVGSVARAFGRMDFVPMLVGMIAAIVAITVAIPFLVPTRPGPIEIIVTIGLSALTFALLGIGSLEVLRSPRQRAAYDAFLWIGRWEYLRAIATGMKDPPTSREEMFHWLAQHPSRPDQAIVRIEGLVWTQQFAAAAAVVEDLPGETPWQRFEKELHRAFVAFIGTGDEDLAAARTAARELRGIERTRADAQLAVEETRHRIAAGDRDWIAPLADARPKIGAAADRLTLRDLGRRQVRVYLLIGGTIGLLTLLSMGRVSLPFG